MSSGRGATVSAELIKIRDLSFSFQDTHGRTILSNAAFQASPDTVVADGQA